MKNKFSRFALIFILAASLFSTNVLAARNQPVPGLDLISGQTATVNYLESRELMSFFDVVISDVPAGAGVYAGWCIQENINGDLRNEPATLYLSTSPNLPTDVAELPWNEVNYLLNHKIHGATRSDTEFINDVQAAIWLVLGQPIKPSYENEFVTQMFTEAMAHPDYVPGEGEIVAVIVYSDGMDMTDPESFQEAIIEFEVEPEATLTPTVTETATGDTPTFTPTFTPTVTGTLTDTPTSTVTATATTTETITDTPTATHTSTPTSTGTIVTEPTTVTPTNTATFTATSTATITNTPTFTPTATLTPTATSTSVSCVPTIVVTDFTSIELGTSVEGMGKVAPGLSIDAKGLAVRLAEGVSPSIYTGPNGGESIINGGMFSSGGFGDLVTQSTGDAPGYVFTFANGTSVSSFSVRMLDFGDYNPTKNASHYVSMTAYNAGGFVVAKQELRYTTPAVTFPKSSNAYGNLGVSGDAVTAAPGEPGNWTWNVSGSGIVRVELSFGAGYDPNIAFDTLTFTTECLMCEAVSSYLADFTSIELGTSVEGMGKVAPGLSIDAKGLAVRLAEGVSPSIYTGPNGGESIINGGMFSSGGFGDLVTQSTGDAPGYVFTFANGTSASSFSVRMLDFGDYNPTKNASHYVSMTAYNAGGFVVAKQELRYTTPAVTFPKSSNAYGNLGVSGDAVTAAPGEPGNWTWNVSGSGIVRVELSFGAGYDPNIAFDTLLFTEDCN